MNEKLDMYDIITQQKQPDLAIPASNTPGQDTAQTNNQTAMQTQMYRCNNAFNATRHPNPKKASTPRGAIRVCQCKCQTDGDGCYSQIKRPKEAIANDGGVNATASLVNLSLQTNIDQEGAKSTEHHVKERIQTRPMGWGSKVTSASRSIWEWRTWSCELPDAKEAKGERGFQLTEQQNGPRHRNYLTSLEIGELKGYLAKSQCCHLGVVDDEGTRSGNMDASSGINASDGIPSEKARGTDNKRNRLLNAGSNSLIKITRRLLKCNRKGSVPP